MIRKITRCDQIGLSPLFYPLLDFRENDVQSCIRTRSWNERLHYWKAIIHIQNLELLENSKESVSESDVTGPPEEAFAVLVEHVRELEKSIANELGMDLDLEARHLHLKRFGVRRRSARLGCHVAPLVRCDFRDNLMSQPEAAAGMWRTSFPRHPALREERHESIIVLNCITDPHELRKFEELRIYLFFFDRLHLDDRRRRVILHRDVDDRLRKHASRLIRVAGIRSSDLELSRNALRLLLSHEHLGGTLRSGLSSLLCSLLCGIP